MEGWTVLECRPSRLTKREDGVKDEKDDADKDRSRDDKHQLEERRLVGGLGGLVARR